jgi:hypothetical protein
VCFFGINFQRLAEILAKKLTGFASRADCRIKEFIHNGLTIDGSTSMSSPSKSIGGLPLKVPWMAVRARSRDRTILGGA